MNTNNGGPASAISLRDYFAAHVISGLITASMDDEVTIDENARDAYRVADAMLAARNHDFTESEPAPEVAETFEMFGKTWTRHVPGDPMPCEPRRYVQCLFENGHKSGITANWTDDSKVAGYGIIGWRYAERSES